MAEKQNQPSDTSFNSARRAVGDGRETAIHVALLVGVCLLLCGPVLIHGIPDISHDGVYHAVWAKQFATQFWQGDWYPRWFSDINAGFGGPSGFFYPPLNNYVCSLFWPLLAAHDPEAWLVAGYALVLAEILSGITAYLWLRSLTKPRAALLGAVAYAIAPYHLAIDLYQRGASAEFWVFVWLPLVLLSAEGLVRRSRWAVPGAAVSYALAVLSHPTVALCFAPLAVAYVFCFSDRQERTRTTGKFVALLLLGVSLDAVYLLPATLDQDKAYVSVQTAAGGWGDYHTRWLWQDRAELSEMGRYLYGAVTGKRVPVEWDFPFKVRTLIVTLFLTLPAIVALFLLTRWFEPADRLRRMALFWLAAAFLYCFLTTKLSVLVWEAVPFLKFLQFPFRLNVMLVICVAALWALASPYLLRPRARPITVLLAILVLGWLGADVWVSTQMFSAWRSAPERTELSRQRMRTQIEFITMWPKATHMNALMDFSAFDRFVASHPPKMAQLEAFSTGQIFGTAQVESWQPRRVVLKIQAPRDSQLTLNHFYYAGWQGRIEDTATILPASPSPDGLIRVDVPRGSYNLILELPQDRAERAGMVISLISLMLAGGIVLRAWRRRNRTGAGLVSALM